MFINCFLFQAAGQKKISTIIKNMSFRRNIMATEWEHQKMRMTINDYIEHIDDIDGVKVSQNNDQAGAVFIYTGCI